MNRFPYSFDRVASVYDDTRTIPEPAAKRLVDAVRGLGVPGRILEVGVGTGRIALPLQRRRRRVVGTDVSPAMLGVARRKGLRNVVLSEAYRLPFGDGTFSMATTNHVLHLLGDWRTALREVCRVTTGLYFSVIGHETTTPDLHAEYSRLVRRLGASTERPGLNERRLPRRLAPDKSVRLGTYRTVEEVSNVLEGLDRRSLSGQWAIPDAVHARAMASLRAPRWGREVRTVRRLELVVWERDRLADFVGAPRRGPGGAGP